MLITPGNMYDSRTQRSEVSRFNEAFPDHRSSISKLNTSLQAFLSKYSALRLKVMSLSWMNITEKHIAVCSACPPPLLTNKNMK